MKGFVDFLFDNDEKVASLLKKNTHIKARGQKPYPIYVQNGSKIIPFGAAYIYIALIREYPPGNQGQSTKSYLHADTVQELFKN